MDVGRETFRYRLENKKQGALLRAKRAVADALVFRKINARTGGRMKLFISGGAPLAREIAEFLGAVGFTVCEGYGLTETSPVITANRPDRMRPGSVGLPFDGVEVRIAEDGEILTRGPHVMKGYYRKPEATAEILEKDGWLHTGDIGIIDADGFLMITDRKKDIIVTSGGKNIAPQPIENRLKADAFVMEAVMIGNRRNYATALVVPAFAALERWAKDNAVTYASRDELVAHPKVVELYTKRIADLTEDLATFERIKKLAILPNEFSLEAGELTPTLKVKRRAIEERYKAIIEKLYEGAAS
jgi:long-chain acyl-CoA synthetase